MTSCSAQTNPRPSGSSTTATSRRCSATSPAARFDAEEAADLTAETFASALVARRRFKPGRSPATAWLFAIAARRLADYQRRGYVEQRMRRSLEMERRPVTEADAEMIRLLGDDAARSVLSELPPEQRRLVAAHVIDERPYGELAGELHTSEAAIRQRMSRGLATLRRGLGR